MSAPSLAKKGCRTTRRRPRKSKQNPARDQDTSRFTTILQRLVDATPGARAAVLVDSDGETVDYAGDHDPFDLKVTAAHFQIIVSQIEETLSVRVGTPRQVTVHARHRSFLVRRVHPGYSVVLVLYPYAAFSVSERALREADDLLCAEAGWPVPAAKHRWFGIEVQTDRGERMRPLRVRVSNDWLTVEVIGTMVGLHRRERGFRIRLASGVEMLLVRERLGRWFADERLSKEEPARNKVERQA
jgi:hypothetical protein